MRYSVRMCSQGGVRICTWGNVRLMCNVNVPTRQKHSLFLG